MPKGHRLMGYVRRKEDGSEQWFKEKYKKLSGDISFLTIRIIAK
jgi:hypothetical protein